MRRARALQAQCLYGVLVEILIFVIVYVGGGPGSTTPRAANVHREADSSHRSACSRELMLDRLGLGIYTTDKATGAEYLFATLLFQARSAPQSWMPLCS